jgi:single-strand DNA-binding protein
MSTDINNVILVGRLTKDATVDYLPNGSAVASISIAVNRNKKEGEQWINEVSYFDISLFGKQAESLRQYLLKGKQIAIQGSLRQDRWEKDGQKFSKVSIVAENVQLLGGKSGNSDGEQSGTYSSEASQYKPQAYQPDSLGGNDFPEDPVF